MDRVPSNMSNIVIPSYELHIDKSSDGLLGRGGYGFVYSGYYKGKKVAVKMLSDNGDIPKTQRNDLKKEARRLRDACHHPHILDLIGVVMETNNYSLVLEYMHFGTCISFIKNYIVGTPVRVQFAQQIISAMAWLHSHKPPVKHLDLKAENVLINNYFIAKISDFGLSEWRTVTMAFSKTQSITPKGPRCGTLSHIPPEVFRDINKKGAIEEDVYAFGITLWEIFSGRVPFQFCGDKEELIRGAVLNNQRPDTSRVVKDCPREIQDMMQLSWDNNPTFRPTFKELEMKIAPVYNSVKDTIHKHFKYIRAQIVTFYQEEPEDHSEKYECTKHWDDQQNGFSYRQPSVKNWSFDKQVGVENGQANLENRTSNSQGNVSDGSFDAPPSTENGSFNLNSSVENGLPNEHSHAENASSNQEVSGLSNEQASPDGEKRDVTFPPEVPLPNRERGPHNNKKPVVNGKPVGNVPGSLRNFGQAHVPISETEQKEINSAGQRDMRELGEGGLSGFVSVREKQYTPGSQLRHPHGPIAQPMSAVIQSSTVANGDSQGQGRTGEEGDDEETILKRDPVDELLSNLRISNPDVYQSLLRNPDALQNLESNLLRSNGGQLEVEPRPSELELSQHDTATQRRPASSCTREVTPQTQLLIGTSVSVDQLSGETSNGERPAKRTLPGISEQQTTPPGARVTVRMHPAPDSVHHLASVSPQTHQSVVQPLTGTASSYSFITPSVTLPQQQTPVRPVRQNVRPFQPQPRQIFGQPVRDQHAPQVQVTTAGTFVHGSQQTQTVQRTGSQQAVNNSIFGQQQSTNQGGGIPGHMLVQPSARVPAASQEPTQSIQPPPSQIRPAEPVSRQQQMAWQQTPVSNTSASSRRPGSPVEVSEQLRPDETSSTQHQPPTNQTHTGAADPNEDRTTQPGADGRQKQPVTIYHRHAGGGTTTITMDPNNELPPNLQIGSKNVMVVNDSGSRKKSEKRKKQKCKKSQLTTCTDELSMDHIDMVSVEIGKDWKRLCRQLDMTEADIEQLQFDYYSSGLYEIMYQGIQRWIQRNGRAANIRTIAEALWEIDRDDIALRLHGQSQE